MHSKSLREKQTTREFTILDTEVVEWSKTLLRTDTLGIYPKHIEVVRDMICEGVKALKSYFECEISKVPDEDPAGAYITCKNYERRIVWLRQCWRYYADKFDQRRSIDSSQLKFLRAADELIWSCFGEVRERLGLLMAPPIPFLDDCVSPDAIVTSRVPHALLKEKDFNSKPLEDFFESLPIPLIRVPSSCMKSPWWLVYLAHEVAHHVDFDLLRKKTSSDVFGEELKNRTKNLPRFSAWRDEIFADLLSLLFIGPTALSCLAEFEFGTNPYARRAHYPSPAIRLHTMYALVKHLGLPEDDIQAVIPVEISDPEFVEDLQFVKEIATLIEVPLVDGSNLISLSGFQRNFFVNPKLGASFFTSSRLKFLSKSSLGLNPKQIFNSRITAASGFAAWRDNLTDSFPNDGIEEKYYSRLVEEVPSDRGRRSHPVQEQAIKGLGKILLNSKIHEK